MINSVTVIIAAYNAGNYIKAAINSLLRQTYQLFNIIIVDDASEDNTIDIVQSFKDPRIILLKNSRNIKQNLSRNIAIDAADGKYIAICDADDICMPSRLEVLVKYLESHQNVDVVGSSAYLFDDRGNILGGLSKEYTEHRDLVSNIHRGNVLNYPTIMARSQWMRKYKYPDDYHGQAEDQEMFLRAYKESCFANIQEFLYGYRDPGLNPRKFLLSIYNNSLMRWRNWRHYSISANKILVFPLIVASRLLYYGVAMVCGKSIMWAHTRPLPKSCQLSRDQQFIYEMTRLT